MIDLQHAAVLRLFIQKVTVGADVHGGVGHHFLTKRIDRRVGHLCEQLFEIVEQQLMLS